MDARRAVARGAGASLGLYLLFVLVGCAALGPRPPQAHPATQPSEPSAVVKSGGADTSRLVAGDEDANLSEAERWATRVPARPAASPTSRRARPAPRATTYEPSPFGYDDAPPDAAEFDDPPAIAPSRPAAATLASQTDYAARMPPPPATPPSVNGVRAITGAANQALAAAAPGSNAPVESDVPGDLRSLLARIAGESRADQSFREQLDQRVLRLLAGDEPGAREPLQLVADAQQEMARHFIDMLRAVRAGHGGEPAGEASRVLGELEKLYDALSESGELQISDLQVCRAVRGFGQYERFEPAEFLAGRAAELVVYCELKNFASRKADDGRFHAEFSLRTRLMSRTGDTLLDVEDPQIVDRCQSRRRDCFIPRLVRLPATLGPGDYVLKSTVVDKIGQKVAEKSVSLRILAGGRG